MAKQLTYLGFEDIPVFNFYKIAETTDVRWFYKNFRSDRSIKISVDESLELLDRYKETYDERVKYTNDVKSIEYYRKLTEVSDLETKLFRMTSGFNVLVDMPFDHKLFSKYLEYFGQEGYVYKDEIIDEKSKSDCLKWLQTKIKGFKTKVNVKKANYADVLKPKEVTTENAKFDVVREKILLQESLGVTINIYKCPLIEWCAMLVRAEEKAADAKRQIEKIKQKR